MTHQMITSGPAGYRSEPCDCDAEIDHGRPVGRPRPENPPEVEIQPQQTASHTRRNTCGGCDTTWTGHRTAHCATCHRTFTGIGPFDLHRSATGEHGACLDPATLTTADGQPRLIQHENGHWGGPGLTDQQRAGLGYAPDAAERINSLPTVTGTLRDMGISVNDIDPAAISRTLRSALQSLDLDENRGDPQ